MILPGRMWVAGAENYEFGFNGKENIDEIYGDDNFVDFGERGYDCRIGRWLSVDNLTGIYPNVSPYVFVLNNPIQNIDPDGQYVKVTTKASYLRYLFGLKPKIKIKVTGRLIDQTDCDYSINELKAIRDRITNQIEESYSGEGETISFTTKVNLKIARRGDKSLNNRDHAFRLEDEGQIPTEDAKSVGLLNGFAPYQGNVVYINNDLTGDAVPAVEGKYANTGKPADYDQNPRGTIEQTAAHELGHSMDEEHPDSKTNPGNLMHQTGQEKAGLNINEEQIKRIRQKYDNGLLNNGQQK